MSAPQEQPQTGDDESRSHRFGIWLGIAAVALWVVPTLTVAFPTLHPGDWTSWESIRLGSSLAISFLAALWVWLGPGKWWLRIVRAFGGMIVLLGVSLLLHFLGSRVARLSYFSGNYGYLEYCAPMMLAHFLSGIMGIGMVRCFGLARFELGPKSATSDMGQIRLAEIFEITFWVAATIAIAFPLSNQRMSPPAIAGLFLSNLIFGGVPVFIYLLVAAYQSASRSVAAGFGAWICMLLVSAWVFMSAWHAYRTGMQVLHFYLGIAWSSYAMVLLVLSACERLGWYRAEEAPALEGGAALATPGSSGEPSRPEAEQPLRPESKN